MKILKQLLMIAILAIATTSCDDPEGSSAAYEYSYSECFNYVSNRQSGKGSVFDDVKYIIKFEMPSYEASVKIMGAKFNERMPAIDFELSGLKWSNNANGVLTISANDVVPVVNGQAMSGYTINQFKVEVYDRYVVIDGQLKTSPVFVIQYTIAEMFDVTVVPEEVLYVASTGVLDVEQGAPYYNSDMLYWIEFDAETMTADIEIDGAKFAEGMPALNDMEFNDIPLTLYTGGYSLAADALIPTIMDVPYPNYAITSLLGNGTFANGMDLRFKCMDRYSVNASLSIVGTTSSNQF